MAARTNTPLRLIVPLALLLGGIGVAIAVATNTTSQRQLSAQTAAQPAAQTGAETEAQSGAQPSGEPADAGAPPQTLPGAAGDEPGTAEDPQPTAEPQPAASEPSAARPQAAGPAAEAPAPGAFHARVFADQAFDPIGSLDPDDAHLTRVEFTPFGAGIDSLALAHDFETVDQAEHVELQHTLSDGGLLAVPLALLAVELDGQRVDLVGFGAGGQLWRQTAPGRFEALIDDADGDPVARVERAFDLEPGRFDLALTQRLVNLTDRPLTVRWVQTGPVNLPKDESSYGGDKRRVRFGTVSGQQIALAQTQGVVDATVAPDTELRRHGWAVGKKTDGRYEVRHTLWPNEQSGEKDLRLVWFALTDRYFCVAVHPRIDPAKARLPEDKTLPSAERLDRLVLNPGADKQTDASLVLELTSPPERVEPGAFADASLGLYAGPMARKVIASNDELAALGLDKIVVYNFGGPCAFCTFPWLTHLLLAVLRFNHSLTGDWALAIILLVVFVRTALHPITRWSQVRMQRFGAQMQALGPKQQKLKEKYADDPKRIQQETAKLWREEGISPAGMLGCLPMFLQTPVWIALYATLFFAAELRHEPGFYGVFQAISGGAWPFLADLSAPDAAVPLPSALHFSFPIWGSVHAINLLPIIMGVVYFIQQKYLMPPTTATMTPEQEQQQKIMKIMMVVMFPVIMYAAPSGLAIYFVTNSTLGILEARWIRSHAKKHGLLDADKVKAKRKPGGGGFLARLQEIAERQQQAQNRARNQGAGFGTGRSRQGMMRSTPDKKIIDRKYKKKRKGD